MLPLFLAEVSGPEHVGLVVSPSLNQNIVQSHELDLSDMGSMSSVSLAATLGTGGREPKQVDLLEVISRGHESLFHLASINTVNISAIHSWEDALHREAENASPSVVLHVLHLRRSYLSLLVHIGPSQLIASLIEYYSGAINIPIQVVNSTRCLVLLDQLPLLQLASHYLQDLHYSPGSMSSKCHLLTVWGYLDVFYPPLITLSLLLSLEVLIKGVN